MNKEPESKGKRNFERGREEEKGREKGRIVN